MANIIKKLVLKINTKNKCDCRNALDHALITTDELIKKCGNIKVNKVLLKRFLV